MAPVRLEVVDQDTALGGNDDVLAEFAILGVTKGERVDFVGDDAVEGDAVPTAIAVCHTQLQFLEAFLRHR